MGVWATRARDGCRCAETGKATASEAGVYGDSRGQREGLDLRQRYLGVYRDRFQPACRWRDCAGARYANDDYGAGRLDAGCYLTGRRSAAANPKSFFQLYWSGDREAIQERIERFRAGGAKGLILTLDATASQPRDWGSRWIPEKLDLAAMIRFAPRALVKPRWLADFMLGGGPPDLKVPNLETRDHVAPTMIEGFMDWMATAMPTTPSPLRYLPAVLDAVGEDAEVTFDSGIRRGADVIKVLTLGAKAALIGRSWFFGLGADGERGVNEVLDTYQLSIDRTLIGLGRNSIHDLNPDDAFAPDDFFLLRSEPLPMEAK